MKKTSRIFAMLLAAALLLMCFACGKTQSTDASKPQAETKESEPQATPVPVEQQAASAAQAKATKPNLVIGADQQVTTLDPMESATFVHYRVFHMTHDPLFFLDDGTGEIFNMLATGYEWQDQLTLKVTLRDDVLFHNGEKFTSDDVVFSMERAKTSKASKSYVKQLESVEAVDDTTVVFHMSSAYLDFVYNLARCPLSILNREACEADVENGYRIGTGMFQIEDFVLNDYVLLRRFDKCYKGTTPTETVKVRYIPEASARVIALQNGEIDYCVSPSNMELDYIKNDSKLKLYSWDSMMEYYLGFNGTGKSEICMNDKLRQAVAMALNKQDIIAVALNGYGVEAYSFWGQFAYAYTPDVGYKYDVEAAKALVAEAGYANGLDIHLLVSGNICVAAAQIVQSQLKLIGLNVIIEEADSSGFMSKSDAGEFDMLIYTRTQNPWGDAIRINVSEGSSSNRVHYYNPKVVELMDLAVGELDEAKRIDLYHQVQELVASDAFYIPICYSTQFAGANADLQNVVPTNQSPDFSYAYIG